MSLLEPLLTPQACYCKVEAGSRKRVLQIIASSIAEAGLDEDTVFDELMARERLGSTGLGEGVAIPHCRVATSAIEVRLVTTLEAVDYEAVDGAPVDIFFAIVVPTEERESHLTALAEISTVLADPTNRQTLRGCGTPEDLHRTMTALISNGDSAQTA